MTAFKKIWDSMAKETTTTFTVTVTHSGDQKDFYDLFKNKRGVLKVDSNREGSKTKKVPPKARYSDEQKMTRNILKQACELAGLTYSASRGAAGTQLPDQDDNWYELNYHWRTRKSGQTYFTIANSVSVVSVEFPNGVGQDGVIVIKDKNNNGRGSIYWGPGNTGNIKQIAFNLANPNILKELSEIFEEHCKK